MDKKLDLAILYREFLQEHSMVLYKKIRDAENKGLKSLNLNYKEDGLRNPFYRSTFEALKIAGVEVKYNFLIDSGRIEFVLTWE